VEQHQPCALSDASVQLCLDFNDAATLGYDSSSGQHDGSVLDVVTMTRDSVTPADPAAQFSTSSVVQIAEAPALDLPSNNAFSIELWLDPSQVPTQTFHILEHPQYSVYLLTNGSVRCTIGATSADTALPIGTGSSASWTHVGCTFDGVTVETYIDGNVAGCKQQSSSVSPPPPGTTGVVVGATLVGGVDNIHVLARTLSASEICTMAGHTGCSTSCPGGQGGD
jgi:hypothetical protein